MLVTRSNVGASLKRLSFEILRLLPLAKTQWQKSLWQEFSIIESPLPHYLPLYLKFLL
jgi:hypothetical protein